MKKLTTLFIALIAVSVAMAQSKLEIYQDCEKGVDEIIGNENGYVYVDLGLPSGIKWSTCNVGADNPWDYGDYFAWGETVGYGKEDRSNAHNYAYTGKKSYVKKNYYWDTYKYCSGFGDNGYNTLTKYNTKSNYGSVVDYKTTLDLADDAAHVNMGGRWRMPTFSELQELHDNCYWEWTDDYNGKGVAGHIIYKVKSDSDKGKNEHSVSIVGSYSLSDMHIFLPAAGWRDDYLNDGFVEYWSSSLYTDSPDYAYAHSFYSYDIGDIGDIAAGDRCYGLTVRGVCSVSASPEVVSTTTCTIGVKSDGCQLYEFQYEQGDKVVMTAIPNYGYVLKQWDDGNTDNPRTITVTGNKTYTATFEKMTYEYVDLGLPSGLKWATCNVGAENPWESGDYFAWGEITPKRIYSWGNYLDGRITDEEDCGTDKDLLNGITDIKGTQYDAATANMGDSWRMPTTEEQRELMANCYWVWTGSYNGKGVKGYIVYKAKDTSDKGKHNLNGNIYDWNDQWGTSSIVATYSLADTHIFFPAVGCRFLSVIYGDGNLVNCWSSSLLYKSSAAYMGFEQYNDYTDVYERCYGKSVRGVTDAGAPPVSPIYTITVTSNNSQYGIVSGGGSFEYNINNPYVIISATPNAGHDFVRWSDGNTQNPRTVIVTGDKTYTAVFGLRSYSITLKQNFTLMGDMEGAGTYEYNTMAGIFAAPKAGYHFVQWNDGNTDNPRYVKVTGDATYTAEFAVGTAQEEKHGETQVNDGIAVTPFETKAEFTWPSITGVASYSLIIWADEAQGKKVCTLTFNANGQLTNIDFTQSVKPQGESVEGLNFTVTGLKQGTTYGYTLDAKDAEDDVIETKRGTFTTMGASGIADITAAGINIYTEGRTIIVENATDAITVSDALGRVVGKDDAQIVPAETRKFPVPSSGVYVVKIGNRSASVLVR